MVYYNTSCTTVTVTKFGKKVDWLVSAQLWLIAINNREEFRMTSKAFIVVWIGTEGTTGVGTLLVRVLLVRLRNTIPYQALTTNVKSQIKMCLLNWLLLSTCLTIELCFSLVDGFFLCNCVCYTFNIELFY